MSNLLNKNAIGGGRPWLNHVLIGGAETRGPRQAPIVSRPDQSCASDQNPRSG